MLDDRPNDSSKSLLPRTDGNSYNPVTSSYYYTVVSVFPPSSSSLLNYLFLIITYFLRTSREVSFPFSFNRRTRVEITLLLYNVCSHQRTSNLSSFPVSLSFHRMLRLIFSFLFLSSLIILYFRILTIHGRVSHQIQIRRQGFTILKFWLLLADTYYSKYMRLNSKLLNVNLLKTYYSPFLKLLRLDEFC